MKGLIGLLMTLVLTLSDGVQAESTVLRLAATDWCPYVCDDKDKPGFVVEYLRAVLEPKGIALQVELFPWGRAVELARSGEYDGLATASAGEAVGLLYPKAPTGDFRMCYFALKSSAFRYLDRDSLRGYTVGIVGGYGYGEPMDSVIANRQLGEKLYTLYAVDPVHSLVGMLRLKRLDAFIEDDLVVAYRAPKLRGVEELHQVGCQDATALYTPLTAKKETSAALVVKLSEWLASPDAAAIYAAKRQRYATPLK